jgi:putative FmdB family regulatory protein
VPTYGYRCEQCSLEFEVWQRMSDDPTALCPTCGGRGRRLFFPAGIVFKGSGFYKTDNRKSGSEGSQSTTSSSTDTAPAAKERSKGTASTSSDSTPDSSG